tara:strand:- start:208 stop:351 length:144 start_codon:yes stop_codon:yes gene_type:complete
VKKQLNEQAKSSRKQAIEQVKQLFSIAKGEDDLVSKAELTNLFKNMK